MDLPIGKLAPTAVVTAVVGYCCWSHFEEPDPSAGANGNASAPAIAAAQLAPAAPPEPGRDPFGLPANPAEAAPPKKVESAPKAAAAIARAARLEAAKALDRLSLRAVWQRNNRSVALINNRFYAEGDSLQEGNQKLCVTRVLADRVLLECQGQTLELKFPDKDSEPNRETRAARSGPPPAPAHGGAGSPAARSAKRRN